MNSKYFQGNVAPHCDLAIDLLCIVFQLGEGDIRQIVEEVHNQQKSYVCPYAVLFAFQSRYSLPIDCSVANRLLKCKKFLDNVHLHDYKSGNAENYPDFCRSDFKQWVKLKLFTFSSDQYYRFN